ncbi:MAG: YegP family protein [Paludibacter sp.]|nr:YegP family protein [Paludibacter sp.]
MAGEFVIRETKTGTKFDLKAGNGEVILTSEVYASLAACKNGIESVRTNAPVAPVEDQTVAGFSTEKNPNFEVYADKSQNFSLAK